ncbi:MAG: hypothetical protein AMXMBFR64_45520 [Myxococcales bacterium]
MTVTDHHTLPSDMHLGLVCGEDGSMTLDDETPLDRYPELDTAEKALKFLAERKAKLKEMLSEVEATEAKNVR